VRLIEEYRSERPFVRGRRIVSGRAAPALGDDHGAALLIVLMCTTLLLALGGGLAMLTATEARIAAHFGAGMHVLYGAEAAVERVLPDLLAAPDWDAVLDGTARSSFVDGPPAGTRTTPGGVVLDLAAATHLERCARAETCTDAEMDAVSESRPSGANNARWQLYGWGPLRDLLPAGRSPSSVYVIVWVGDDPFETDDDPLRDGGSATGAGRGVLLVRARAYGTSGARRGVEAVVAKGSGRLRVVSWREL
jgi:hypothetical protein